MRLLMVLFLALSAAHLSGCGIAPTHPALQSQALPPLIPVRDFVANREGSGSYRVSPDGKKLAWMGVDGIRSAVWVKTIGQDDARSFAVRARGIAWSGDSRFVLLTVDRTGDEDTHVFAAAVDADKGAQPLDLTPFTGTRSSIVRVVSGSADVVMASNLRDKKVFDLYRVDAASGQRTLMATNPGNASGWFVDRDGRLLARVLLEGEYGVLQRPEEGALWRTTAQWSRNEKLWLADAAPDGKSAWAVSSRGRDKAALVRLDLESGAEQVLYADPVVDIEAVLISRKTRMPLMAHSMPGYPRQEIFDDDLRARLAPLADGQPAAIYVNSIDSEERAMTVSVSTDRGTRSYLLAGPSAAPELLGETSVSLLAPSLGTTTPITYASRDGLLIHGYLTVPPGLEAKQLPMVLLVHGGPWARDTWTLGGSNRSPQQFFANRGYAVLQVNYRGSSGYGRAFQEKAVGEFAGKMHDDLIDGVRWAVQGGVADPKRVAVYGASYGGYAALLGATLTPEVFACAVDVVGVTDLARLLETAPPYWELGLPWWKRFVGDPADPAQRKVMDARSPVNLAGHAQKPILIMHGVNDPRVKFEQSTRMVAALREQGKDVEFVSFQGDGHGNQKWSNNLTMYRKTEDFLARCLGGRSSGFDYYQLGAWAF